MIITTEEQNRLETIYQAFLNDEKILRMKDISMHRGSNCYIHSFKVAKKAIKKSLNRKDVNLEVVLLGAILHDYYLYDWRKDRSKRKGHGKNHPKIASANASRDFDIPPEVKEVIETHMWPFNFKQYPHSREAKLVANADNYVATVEALTSIAYKKKKREKYLAYIAHLF